MRLPSIVAAVAATAALASPSMAGIVYTQTSTTGLNSSSATIPDVLDDVSFAAGTTTTAQRLSSITFGYVVAAGTAAQSAGVTVLFYDTVNAAATGTVESAYLGGFSGTLNVTANTGTSGSARSTGFATLETLTTPIDFRDDNIGVEIYFTNAAGTAYSTVLTNLMSTPGLPTVGSSVTGVYRDANNDGLFQATELNVTQGNLYLSITTINAPEPTTLAALTLLGGIAGRRRRIA
jgi:hypothetical protein